MDEEQWMHDSIMSEEVDMNEQNEDEAGLKSKHIDCSDVFSTSQVTMDKGMNITDMGYVIASRSQPPTYFSVHRVICIGHVYDYHFIQVFLRYRCPLLPLTFLWSTHCHPQAK
ncbi:uncharacterized protein [Glycine max]|uniref:uncharacterized protein n=1 Tax=Glycine max TaxID=3847 RepID=UPI0003DEC880|nr:uncharacterized protein LOC102660865 [Glycine max]XP_040870622.1 uncharacterized protein LOC102660865 [Glycine max]|eukprot:XP_006578549.1 uncharacterized protein LOC102660865 [Glycine max]